VDLSTSRKPHRLPSAPQRWPDTTRKASGLCLPATAARQWPHGPGLHPLHGGAPRCGRHHLCRGSGGTALVTPAMRSLPVGVPKVMVSTVASGNVRQYVGPSDICMMYSVTDVAGINRISASVLSNAANALAGMIGFRQEVKGSRLPAIGLTMFGVTTPCVQAVIQALKMRYDCLVFHATGTGANPWRNWSNRACWQASST